MASVFFEPETEEFNLIRDKSNKDETGSFDKIKWKPQQLELFEEFKKIKQNFWIQIYDVYLDKDENVTCIGFRLTPEGSFYHEYPDISFDKKGNIEGNLKEELEYYKDEGAKAFNLVKNFFMVLIDLQNKQKINKN